MTVQAASDHWAMALTEAEAAAVATLRAGLGLDPVRTFGFWEQMVARMLDGRVTAHGCGWDVELDYGAATIRIEVKYAQETSCRFRDGVRPVMKFAAPKGEAREKAADVIVLVGVDADDRVWTWVVPAAALRKCASVTLTSPRARLHAGKARSPVESWRVPFDQLLPETLRAYRHHLPGVA